MPPAPCTFSERPTSRTRPLCLHSPHPRWKRLLTPAYSTHIPRTATVHTPYTRSLSAALVCPPLQPMCHLGAQVHTLAARAHNEAVHDSRSDPPGLDYRARAAVVHVHPGGVAATIVIAAVAVATAAALCVAAREKNPSSVRFCQFVSHS